ncbi:MAG: UDP-N-acetylmuramoyl-L-alanine--D-glutamate ligase [Lachnospiraceae bacterium]|nr:UDP-N-acetylmuramoyl-L-alanine--D-glutamate ligase [Lachnospiraceae bacterium]
MDLKNKKVLVYGAGKSGIGAAILLAKVGARPVLFDEKEGVTPAELLDRLGEDVRGQADAFAGKLKPEIIREMDIAVLSPGVPTDIPNVEALKEAGVPIWGEVELAYRISGGKVLGITGTNGKTTTTTILGEIMKNADSDTYVVGNIGNPYTDAALSIGADSNVVIELSSFQLETIDEFHPVASAILNITPDHLNRHHTMEEYIRCKERIAENQTAKDVCVLNYEDEVLREFGKICKPRVFWFSSARRIEDGIYYEDGKIILTRDGRNDLIAETDKLALPGLHNYENIMAAAAMAYSAGAPLDVIKSTVIDMKPVEHRIEYVDEKNGVIWYNDSKGTNPDAAIKGIQAMSRPTLLIGGGYDKGSDYREWIRSFDGKVKWLVLEGKTRFDIRDAALECGFPEDRIVLRDDMQEAMNFCRDHAEPGDAVLLSPACASWGEFPNYEVRGEKFKEYVRKEI